MENLAELGNRVTRKVYLITYSRADPALCTTREEFKTLVIDAFRFNEGRPRLLHWAVCKESHEGGGYHFHMCVALSQNKRWMPCKRRLEEQGIVVNFQERGDVYNYVGAYIYVCKNDREVLESVPHPNLTNVVQYRTANACAANRRNGRRRNNNAPPPPKKLTNLNVMQIIRTNNIRSDTALLALAEDNFEQGHTALIEFIANTTEKRYKDLISKTWKVVTARDSLRRAQGSRMERLEEAYNEPCIDKCGETKVWLTMAKEVLQNNNINVYVFAEAVRKLLIHGRSKGRNIIITGPRDCAKTFVLYPLTKIFLSFTNPSSGTYAFVGIQDKEVAFLNDLRYTPTMLPWQDFLNLLEGLEVHIPTPKTHYAEDIEVTSDIPIFATSIGPIKFVGRSNDCAGEDEMMACRWREFSFTRSIPKEEKKEFPPCTRCFAELIFQGRDMD